MDFNMAVLLFLGFMTVSFLFLWFKVFQLFKLADIHAKQVQEFTEIIKNLMEAARLQTVALSTFQAELATLQAERAAHDTETGQKPSRAC